MQPQISWHQRQPRKMSSQICAVVGLLDVSSSSVYRWRLATVVSCGWDDARLLVAVIGEIYSDPPPHAQIDDYDLCLPFNRFVAVIILI